MVAVLCVAELCMERVLPQTEVMHEPVCQERLQIVVDDWLGAHEGYTLESASCQSLESLRDRAAAVTETAPGHFVHEGRVADFVPDSAGDLANTGFIAGSSGVAVIDSGTTRQVAEALYLAVRLSSTLPITHHIITHVHPDHSLGAEVFKEAGAEVIGSAGLRPAALNANPVFSDNLLRLLGPRAFHGTSPITPDRGIESAETINLGGRPLHLQAWPTSHTNSDLTVIDENSATIWMGDLAFLDHLPALDGSIVGWIQLLSRMAGSPDGFEYSVSQMVPGHGKAPVEFPDGVVPTLGYLETLAAEVRQSISDGESLTEATKHIGKAQRGDWQLFDEYHLRNVTNAYVELEWE